MRRDSLHRRSVRSDGWTATFDVNEVYPVLDPDEDDWLSLLYQGSRIRLEMVKARHYVSCL